MKPFSTWLEARIEHPEMNDISHMNERQLEVGIKTISQQSRVSLARLAAMLVRDPDSANDHNVNAAFALLDRYLRDGTPTTETIIDGLSESITRAYNHARWCLVLRWALITASHAMRDSPGSAYAAAYCIHHAMRSTPSVWVTSSIANHLRHLLPKTKNFHFKNHRDPDVTRTLRSLVMRPDHEVTDEDMRIITRLAIDEFDMEKDDYNWEEDHHLENKHQILQSIRRELQT